jgi:3-phosphoshikimate 1-carboxyvinyltransferase
MQTVTITPSIVSGIIEAPPSKSCMQRACAAALLKGGDTIIENFGISNDDRAAIEIIQQLGAVVSYSNNTLHIKSNFKTPTPSLQSLTIDCHESGLSLRMFTIIAALLNKQIEITGSGSLVKRPIDFFEHILPQLGVSISLNNGLLPLQLSGKLIPQNITIDGNVSSQFLTGLLFAYSYCNVDATILVTNLKSKPYIDLTLQVLKDFGLNVPVNNNYLEFIFSKKTTIESSTLTYYIEGDWSNAAFLLVAAAIGDGGKIVGLNKNSSQADKAILQVLEQCGCNVQYSPNAIDVVNICATKGILVGFNFDATHCPDLFPPLVALAAYCKGKSTIKGVSRLIHKESNRAIALQQEFGKMGLQIELQNDDMVIEGTALTGAIINSHNDHRIAMACAVAATAAQGNTVINNAGAINKSYPNFYTDLVKMGVHLQLS